MGGVRNLSTQLNYMGGARGVVFKGRDTAHDESNSTAEVRAADMVVEQIVLVLYLTTVHTYSGHRCIGFS